ncbi:MAG: DUF4294 domain-containing protein [Bacteroidales bacterium]
MNKLRNILFFLVLISGFLQAQDVSKPKRIITYARIVDGDTIPYYDLATINVSSSRVFLSAKEKRDFDKLVRNVKKVYPYAKLAGIKLRQYNEILAKAPTDGERRKIMKRAEKEIKDEFGGELKNLTFSQGKILIKLLYRETGSSSYALVQELRGKFVAFFYQAFARLFGYNLKVTYDPEGEDRPIEIVVGLIEKGLV